MVIFSCPVLLGTVLAYPMHNFRLPFLFQGTLAQLACGQPGVGPPPAAREKSSPTVMPPWISFFHQVLWSSTGLLPSPSLILSLRVRESAGLRLSGAWVLLGGARRASGRRKAELANLFLGALVSQAKDCLNCTNPQCLWSNLVYKSRRFKRVS